MLGGEKRERIPLGASRKNDRRLTSGAWELAPNYLGLLRLNLDFQKYVDIEMTRQNERCFLHTELR